MEQEPVLQKPEAAPGGSVVLHQVELFRSQGLFQGGPRRVLVGAPAAVVDEVQPRVGLQVVGDVLIQAVEIFVHSEASKKNRILFILRLYQTEFCLSIGGNDFDLF